MKHITMKQDFKNSNLLRRDEIAMNSLYSQFGCFISRLKFVLDLWVFHLFNICWILYFLNISKNWFWFCVLWKHLSYGFLFLSGLLFSSYCNLLYIFVQVWEYLREFLYLLNLLARTLCYAAFLGRGFL